MKTVLTPEQSQRLIDLGVDPNMASENVLTDEYNEQSENFRHPCFTLADILSILPKEIEYNKERISLQMYQHLAEYWIVSYVKYSGNELIYQKPLCAEKELIDALNELLILCLEQKIIKLKED